jgi:hypothetical protein
MAALGLCAGAARAGDEPAIPTECGTRHSFDEALRQRLGSDVALDQIQVSITREAARFHLRVKVGNELRELDDESCPELLRAAVVVVVAISMHEREARAPAPSAPPPAPASQSPRPQLALSAGAGVNVGTLPKPVLALELAGKALWQRWGLELDLRYLAPADKLIDESHGVRVQALGVGLSGLWRPSPLWETRLGFAAQRLFGDGLGPATAGVQSRQPDATWAAGPTLGLGFVPALPEPFWAGAEVDGQLDLLRGRFEILNYKPEVFAVRWLAGSAFVRLGVVW